MMFFFPFICRSAPTTCSELSRWLIQSKLQVAFLITSLFLFPILLLSPKFTVLSSFPPAPFTYDDCLKPPLTHFFPSSLGLIFWFPFLSLSIYHFWIIAKQPKKWKLSFPHHVFPSFFSTKHKIFLAECHSLSFFKQGMWIIYVLPSPKQHNKSTMNAFYLMSFTINLGRHLKGIIFEPKQVWMSLESP